MEKAKQPNGYVVFEGASALNGQPIMGILTVKSGNKKTGNMAQLWIMLQDVYPGNVRKDDNADFQKDEAICGQCPMRQSLGGACYVNLSHGPRAVYAAYKDGKYPVANDLSIFEGLNIRFGAYGDPAAIPVDILATLKRYAKNNTSYTHQWKTNKDNAMLKAVSMASVDSPAEALEAKEAGFRYFRVTNDLSTLRSDEIICPNSTHQVKCADCNLCSGNSVKAKNIVIENHGTFKKYFKGE